MPCLSYRTLFSEGGTTVTRSSCDGQDSPQPCAERASGDSLLVTLRGRFCFRHRLGRQVFDPSRAIWQPAAEEYVPHHPDGGDECLIVTSPMLARSLGPWQVVPLTVEAQLRLHDFATRMEGEPLPALAIEETLATLFAAAGSTTPRLGTARWRALADEIAHEIAVGFDQPLPLSVLAARVGLSPFAACRVFRRATGSSIHRYQLELRLRHALTLLLQTSRPLADIAVATGFSSQGHFGNHFRRRYGLPPGQVRTPQGKKALAASLPHPTRAGFQG